MLSAPRSLNEPVACRHSAFRRPRSPPRFGEVRAGDAWGSARRRPRSRRRAASRSAARDQLRGASAGRGARVPITESCHEGIGCVPYRAAVRWERWGSWTTSCSTSSPRSAAGRRAGRAARAGSPTATSAPRSAARDYVIRAPRQGHGACSGSTARPSGSPASGGAPGHRAGGGGAASTDCLVTALRGRARRSGGARAGRARRRGDRARRCARFHDSGVDAADALLGSRPARRLRARSCASAAARCPPPTRDGRRSPRGSPRRCRCERAAPLPQRPAPGQHHPRTRRRDAR